jgi:hypothetical protein
MNYKYIVVLVILFLSGCSTHMTRVEYEGTGINPKDTTPSINEVIVSDERGTESDWLGAIRGGYGNRLKTLRTEESTDIVVDSMYTDALIKSGLYTKSEDAPYSLKVKITKFDCSYYWNREAHAYVDVSLINNLTSSTKFSKTYKTDKVEGGAGAGIFGSVDSLRNLAENTMNKSIDKMLMDSEFIKSLAPPNIQSKPKTASGNGINARLLKLETLYKEGIITEEEYKEKRGQIISEI